MLTVPIVIDDPDDPRFRQFRLHERGLASRADKRDDAGAGLFIAEGDLVVERAVAAGCVPVAALVDLARVPRITDELACPVYGGGDEVRRVVSGLGVPSLIIALFERPPRPSVGELISRSDRLVVVEAIDNPANIGSIIRNAAGLGWDGMILDHTSADPLARRSLRVAMGTVFDLPHARTATLVPDLARAATDGAFELYALTPHHLGRSLETVNPADRSMILIGAERTGLSRPLMEIATAVRIPMAGGVDSLNVASVAAVACWALGRR
jgi:tRNA G18 (ribose-2'-O)-methylase SpoU